MLRTMGNLIHKIWFLEGVRSVRGPVITVQLERMNFPATSSMNWKEVARVCIFDCESPWWGRGRSRYDSTKVLAKCFTTLCHIHFLFKGLCSFPKDNTAVRHVILEPLCFQFLFFPNMFSGLRVAEGEMQSLWHSFLWIPWSQSSFKPVQSTN